MGTITSVTAVLWLNNGMTCVWFPAITVFFNHSCLDQSSHHHHRLHICCHTGQPVPSWVGFVFGRKVVSNNRFFQAERCLADYKGSTAVVLNHEGPLGVPRAFWGSMDTRLRTTALLIPCFRFLILSPDIEPVTLSSLCRWIARRYYISVRFWSNSDTLTAGFRLLQPRAQVWHSTVRRLWERYRPTVNTRQVSRPPHSSGIHMFEALIYLFIYFYNESLALHAQSIYGPWTARLKKSTNLPHNTETAQYQTPIHFI